MSAAPDYSGWSMVRCPTAADRIPDCEPAWVQATREFPEPEPARITSLPDLSICLETTMIDDPPICAADPPDDGPWGDCWCTLAPGHDGDCVCGPCTERFEAPGWEHDDDCCVQEPT